MGEAAIVTIDRDEFETSYVFVSSGGWSEHGAYISRDTGKIHWTADSGVLDDVEELPEDLDEPDRYISIPHKYDLNLGNRLALRLAEQEMPNGYDRVARYFQRRGAYARFRDLLELRDMLKRWYEFEESATDEALREWCAENGIRLVGKPPVRNP